MGGWILIAILVAIAAWVIMTYNSLVSLKNQVDAAWRQIDVQLKRRHDLIPNLVEAVKGYMHFERDTLTQVVEARNRAVSAPDQGTSVMVLLPRAPAEASAVPGLEAPPQSAGGTTPKLSPVRGATVLLVDDEESVRTTIGAMVESAGFSLVTAASGNAALDLVRGGIAFDLLMVDFAMPWMTGLAVAGQRVRLRPASAGPVTIIPAVTQRPAGGLPMLVEVRS